MPTLGAGPRGYKDWQREENWDGPFVVQQSAVAHSGAFTTAMAQASRYGYLMGLVNVEEHSVLMTAEWFADVAGTEPLGHRNIVLNAAAVTPAQLHLTNLGPFVRLTFTPSGGEPTYKLTGRLFLTNRLTLPELSSANPVLANGGITFGGAGELLWQQGIYFAGPVEALVFAEGASVAYLRIMATTELGVEEEVDRVVAPAGDLVVQRVVFPLSAVNLKVVSGGAQHVRFSLTPFVTGSS